MSKKILGKAVSFFMLWVAVSAFAIDHLGTTIDRILATYAADVSYGILVKSLDTGTILYQKNADRYLMPASTLKVFTAISSLTYLGPDYQFDTKITTQNPQLVNGVLHGDVYFQFDGDPTLTKQNLEQMVSDLAAQGIRSIQGNIYLDDYVFDQDPYGRGWMWDELNSCYAAPTYGIALNKNCLWLQVRPTVNGQPPIATMLNEQPYSVTIKNYTLTKAASSYCPLQLHVNDDNEYFLSGCVNPKFGVSNFHVAIKNTRLYTRNLINFLLAKYQIKTIGKIAFKVSEPNSFVLVSHKSLPLSQLVHVMLKHSDNQIADALYKKTAFYYFNKTASWIDGTKAIHQILTKYAHVNLAKARIYDGAGLSRYNLVSPSQMLTVLSYAYRDPKINQVFINALPKSGLDGSLHWRMGQNGMLGKVRAKTGTMTGVSGLAGYLETASHKNLSFVILFNAFPDSHHKYEQLENLICSQLYRL